LPAVTAVLSRFTVAVPAVVMVVSPVVVIPVPPLILTLVTVPALLLTSVKDKTPLPFVISACPLVPSPFGNVKA